MTQKSRSPPACGQQTHRQEDFLCYETAGAVLCASEHACDNHFHLIAADDHLNVFGNRFQNRTLIAVPFGFLQDHMISQVVHDFIRDLSCLYMLVGHGRFKDIPDPAQEGRCGCVFLFSGNCNQLLALFLVLYWAERRAVSRLIRDQQKQLEDIRDLLDGEQGNRQAVFPEFQPVYDSISYRISRLINDRMEIERTLNLRKDFVANASHELRSPLTSVRGFAEMLEEDLAETPKERKICLETIISECDRMLEVIEDILLLSKSAKKTEENIRKISAAETAEEVRHAIRPQAAKKNISIEISGNTVIRAEEKDIWEVFYNLMDNAVRYGKNGGFVRVVMSDGEISVEDDGIGIAPENLKSVFDEFYRVDEAKNEVPGGTGLGLSIVKTIVEKLGGTIRAESVYGKGSRFIIEFQEKTDDEEIR